MSDLIDCLNAELNKPYSIINDVTLIGSDGVHVPACRAILAVRSKQFQQLFYGHRTKCPSYTFSFPSSVMQAFVKYCYTDAVDRPCNFNDETAIALVQLQIFGEHMGITKLHDDVWRILDMKLRAHPGCVCAVMEELMNRDCINNVEKNIPANKYTVLWELCFEQIDEKPIESLLPEDRCISGIRGRSFRLLETILQGMGRLLHPMIAVKVLKEWNRISGQTITGDERAKLQKLADSIDLSCLSQTDIARFEPCDLFSKEIIDTASLMSRISRETRAFQSKRDERNSKPAPSAAPKGFLDLPPSAGNDGTQRKENGLEDNLQQLQHLKQDLETWANAKVHDKKDKRKANTNSAVPLPSDPGYVLRQLRLLEDLRRIEARNSQLAPPFQFGNSQLAPPFQYGKRKEMPNNLAKSPAKRQSKKMKTQAKTNDLDRRKIEHHVIEMAERGMKVPPPPPPLKPPPAATNGTTSAVPGQKSYHKFDLDLFLFGGQAYYYARLGFYKTNLVISSLYKGAIRINLADIDHFEPRTSKKVHIFIKKDAATYTEVTDMSLQFQNEKGKLDFVELLGKHVPTSRKNDKTIPMQRNEGKP